MKSEQGYMFPMVMILAAAFFLAISAASEKYVIDKKFYKLAEERLAAEHLLRLAIAELEEGLAAGGINAGDSGTLRYPRGKVDYRCSRADGTTISVTLSAAADIGGQKSGMVSYDTERARMIEWIEK